VGQADCGVLWIRFLDSFSRLVLWFRRLYYGPTNSTIRAVATTTQIAALRMLWRNIFAGQFLAIVVLESAYKNAGLPVNPKFQTGY
jgi:hypothetical protein